MKAPAKTMAAIRTHRWGEDEQRLYQTLRPIFGDDMAVVFHNRPANLDLNLHLKTIDINGAWLKHKGLRAVRDWGWRCGDYFYYALREACADYDQYWLIEPDVLFNGDAEDFFDRFADVGADALGFGLASVPRSHPFASAMDAQLPLRRAIFALTRFSGPALDHLLETRRANGHEPCRPRHYPNDEIFAFSHIGADDRFRLEALEAHAPKWFDDTVLTTDPDMFVDAIRLREDAHGKIFHPASGREAFKHAVAQRLVNRSGYLNRMTESLDCLEDSDLQDIAEKAKQSFLATLRRQLKD